MTKREIIIELHNYGEVWANESYPKAYLEDYLQKYREARQMSMAELMAKIMEKKKGE